MKERTARWALRSLVNVKTATETTQRERKKVNRASTIPETTPSSLRDVYLEALNFFVCGERGRRIRKNI